AEGAGVGERGRGGQALEVGARVELLDDEREQLVLGCFLEEGHKWFERAEGESLRFVAGDGGAESKFGGEPGAKAGGDHAFADVGKELAAGKRNEKAPGRRKERVGVFWAG